MGLFSKKKGGTFFGNLLGKVANGATGGILGAKRVEALGSGNLAAINPTAKVESKGFQQAVKDSIALGIGTAGALGGNTGTLYNTSFAGQPATYDPATGTYGMKQNLNEVTIKPDSNPVDALLKVIGDKVSYLGGRATEQTKVGVDDNTKWLIGGLAGVGLLIWATKN